MITIGLQWRCEPSCFANPTYVRTKSRVWPAIVPSPSQARWYTELTAPSPGLCSLPSRPHCCPLPTILQPIYRPYCLPPALPAQCCVSIATVASTMIRNPNISCTQVRDLIPDINIMSFIGLYRGIYIRSVDHSHSISYIARISWDLLR